MADLVRLFDQAMLEIYRRAKAEAKYNATIFIGMLHSKGGLATAKQLINAARPSDGYTHLYERGRLDLTVEATILADPRWRSLFTDEELTRAEKRLADYGYNQASPTEAP